MTKNIKISLYSVLAVVLIGLGALTVYWVTDSGNSSQQTVQETSGEVSIQSFDSGETITYQGQNGKTALALLRSGAEVSTESFAFGEMVVSIDGVTAESSQFWGFYVNDEMASVGAADYVTSSDEEITWKLEDIE